MLAAQLSQRYVDALNGRHFDVFRHFIADDVHFYSATSGALFSSPDEVVASYEQAFATMPEARLEVVTLVATDDWAAMELNVVSPSHTLRHSVFHRWADDKLVYYHNYVDPSSQPHE
jgi:hypothetical protein